MNLAVIPARGGSKRVPRKNVRDFCGRPMIAWPVAAAVESGCFDHVVVSTDDAEIAAVAERWGAEAPFVRPPELSDDHTPTRPVVNHAIRAVTELYGAPEHVCCLYATAPFVTAADLRDGLRTLTEAGSAFAFTVVAYRHPIQRAFRITATGRVAMFQPEFRLSRSQDLVPAYHDAGQFYWGHTQAFLDDVVMFSEAAVPIVVPSYRAIDIDTADDFRHAELVFAALREGADPGAAAERRDDG